MPITGIPGWGSSRPPATPVTHRGIPTVFRAGDLNVPQDQNSARGSRAEGSAGARRGGGRAVPGRGRERARRAAQARPSDPSRRERGDSRTALALSWRRSAGPGRIVRYRVYRNRRQIGRTSAARFAVTGPAMRDELRLLGPRRRRRRPPLSRGPSAGCGPPPARRPTPRRRPPRRASPSPSRRRPGSTSRGCRRPTTCACPATASRATAPRSRARPRPASRWAGSPAARRTAFTVVAYDAAGNVSLPASIRRDHGGLPRPDALHRRRRRARRRPRGARGDEAPRHRVLHRAGHVPRAQRDPRPATASSSSGRAPASSSPAVSRLTGFAHSGALWTAAGTTTTAAYAEGDGFRGYLHPQAPYANDVTRRRRAAREDRRARRRQGLRRRRVGGRPRAVLRRLRRRDRSRSAQIRPAMTSRWASRRTGSARRPPAS